MNDAKQRLQEMLRILALPEKPEDLLKEIISEYMYRCIQVGRFPTEKEFGKILETSQGLVQKIAKKIATLNKSYKKFI